MSSIVGTRNSRARTSVRLPRTSKWVGGSAECRPAHPPALKKSMGVAKMQITVTSEPTITSQPASTSTSTGDTTTGAPIVDSGPPPDPSSAQGIAYKLLPSYGFSTDQFGCLNNIWTRESGWRYNAENASGAYGIPQALPGSKMASAGADWMTDPTTQIKWGLGYIKSVYGTPCAAWQNELDVGSY